MNRECIFSPCRKYRYVLWREFPTEFLFEGGNHMQASYVQFIGLNPSTADEKIDDPTIRRCIAYAKAWGYGAFCMTNIFAFRHTAPEVMKMQEEPIGPDNDKHLIDIGREAGVIVAAWGNHGTHMGRDVAVRKLFADAGLELKCLRITGKDQPEHPLYLKKTLKPIPF